jgi:hypothetical protein
MWIEMAQAGSCSVLGFGIVVVEPSDFASVVFVH